MDNIVATMETGLTLDPETLKGLKNRHGKVPVKMGSYTYRLRDTSVTVQIFTSGKIVLTGNTTPDGLEMSKKEVIEDLKSIGVKLPSEPELKIHNLVTSGDLKRPLDLTKLSLQLGLERTEYEPEQFPGLIYRMDEPPATVLLFNTGKIVCTGVSRPEDVLKVAEYLSGLVGQ